MSERTRSSSSTTSPFLGLLALLFIALRLTGFIDWSWWWVLTPLWGPVAIYLLLILAGKALLALADWVDAREARRKSEK